MGIRNFKSYLKAYKEFHEGVSELAEMEDKFSRQEATIEEAKKYHNLMEDILLQCPEGTNIEDLIGLVVVGESKKKK